LGICLFAGFSAWTKQKPDPLGHFMSLKARWIVAPADKTCRHSLYDSEKGYIECNNQILKDDVCVQIPPNKLDYTTSIWCQACGNKLAAHLGIAEYPGIRDIRPVFDAELDLMDDVGFNESQQMLKALRTNQIERGVNLISFGYKHGTPEDEPFSKIYDIRTRTKNPWHQPELRKLTGLNEAVRAYVLSCPRSQQVVEVLTKRAISLKAGTIYIGCHGGKHRSVAIAEAIAESLSAHNAALTLPKQKFPVTVSHRDVNK
jgi:hypothetical protein